MKEIDKQINEIRSLKDTLGTISELIILPKDARVEVSPSLKKKQQDLKNSQRHRANKNHHPFLYKAGSFGFPRF